MIKKKRPTEEAQAAHWWLPSFAGVFFGFILFSLTFTPSLIPRPPFFQGLLGGMAFFIGYAFGHGGVLLWRYLELPEVPSPWRRAAKVVLALGCVIFAALYVPQAAKWQDEVRAGMDMPPTDTANLMLVCLVAAVVGVSLIILTRLVIGGVRMASALVYQWVPRRIAALLGAVVFIGLLVSVVNGTLVSSTISSIDRAQALVDVTDPPGASMPTEATRSGGPASQIAWEDLGRAGKRFVTEGPRKKAIEAFTGRPALEPIRVYAGLRTASSPAEQARLALDELSRMGAFSRSILVIATPTGTGWADNNAMAPLEYMHGGDIATVAVQYSYLQSALSLILEPGRSQKSAAAVFNVIYRHWKKLPKDSRPKLYLFGLSLGSLGSEASLPIFAWLGNSFHGAVWAGPTFRNRIWRTIHRDRNQGSPAWRPTFENGSNFRVIGHGDSDGQVGAGWGRVRIVYIAYPSDAITFFEEAMFFRMPEWMAPPRGAGVSPLLQWFPIITALQVGIDMLFAAAVPPGKGHNYAASDYIEAWAAVTAPQNWSDEDSSRLGVELEVGAANALDLGSSTGSR